MVEGAAGKSADDGQKGAGKPGPLTGEEVDQLIQNVLIQNVDGTESSDGDVDQLLESVDREVPDMDADTSSRHPVFDTVHGDIDFHASTFLEYMESRIADGGFIQDFHGILQDATGKDPEIKFISSESLTLAEVVLPLPEPTAYRHFTVGSHHGLIELNPSIFFPLMQKGDLKEDYTIPDESPLKDGARRELWESVSGRILEKYSLVADIRLDGGQISDNPLSFNRMRQEESMFLACFELSVADWNGLANFALPIYPLAFRQTPFSVQQYKDSNEGRGVAEILAGINDAGLKRLRECTVTIDVDLGSAVREFGSKGDVFYLERDPSFVDVYANGMFLGTGYLDIQGKQYSLTMVDFGEKRTHTERRLRAEKPLAVGVRLQAKVGFNQFYKMERDSTLVVGNAEDGFGIYMHGKRVGNSPICEYTNGQHIVEIKI